MTIAEQKRIGKFLQHVERRLRQIEANFRMMRSLHEFEVTQLKAKHAKQLARARKAR